MLFGLVLHLDVDDDIVGAPLLTCSSQLSQSCRPGRSQESTATLLSAARCLRWRHLLLLIGPPLGLTGEKIPGQGAFHLGLRSLRQKLTVLFLVFALLLLQLALGLGAQLGHLRVHALRVCGVFIVSELLLREGTSLGPGLKPSEKESVGAVIEELVLGLARILVHRLSDNSKVYERVLKILVILVVPVGKDQQFDQLDKHELGLLAECVEESRELMLHKID